MSLLSKVSKEDGRTMRLTVQAALKESPTQAAIEAVYQSIRAQFGNTYTEQAISGTLAYKLTPEDTLKLEKDDVAVQRYQEWARAQLAQTLQPRKSKGRPRAPEEVSLLHLHTLRQHVQRSTELSRPRERILFELERIFCKRYPQQMLEKEMDAWLNGEAGELEDIPMDPAKLSKGERIDYTNPAKEGDRKFWMDHLWQKTKDLDKSGMNLILLPGPECHELSPVIKMGFPPDNIITYIRGDDAEANSTFILNCQAQGVFNWHIGEMADDLPDRTNRVHGGNIDMFGQYCPSYERILQSIPVPANGETHFTFNFKANQEHAKTVEEFRRKSGMMRQENLMDGVHSFGDFYNAIAGAQQFGLAEPAPMQEDRKMVIPIMLEMNLGTARRENWICPDELMQLGKCTGEHPDFESYPAVKQVEILDTYINDAGIDTMRMMEHGFAKDERLSPGFRTLVEVMLHSLVYNAALNRPHVLFSDNHEYISPGGSTPFMTHFVTFRHLHDRYMELEKTLKFFLQISAKNLQMSSNPDLGAPLAYLSVENVGDEACLVYHDLASIFTEKETGPELYIELKQLHDDILRHAVAAGHANASDFDGPRRIFKCPTINTGMDSRLNAVRDHFGAERFQELLELEIANHLGLINPLDRSKGVPEMQIDGPESIRQNKLVIMFVGHRDKNAPAAPQSSYQLPVRQRTPERPVSGRDPVFLMDHDPQPRMKIGRNDKCHCGSGKKFKNCHGQH